MSIFFFPQLSYLPLLALLSSGYPKDCQAEHHNYRSRVTCQYIEIEIVQDFFLGWAPYKDDNIAQNDRHAPA